MTGIWAVVALATAGCGVGDSTVVLSTVTAQTERSETTEEALLRTDAAHDAVFRAAGEEFQVPPALLKAMAWSLTRYEMVEGSDEFEGQAPRYGLMALSGESLAEAARLAGVTEEAVKTDVTANVRATAALLSTQATRLHIDTSKLSSWGLVVGEYSGIEEVGARMAFARGEVFTAMVQGVGVLTDELAGTPMGDELETQVGEYATVAQALSRAPDYGGAVWRPSPNYSSRPAGYPPQMVVIHTCEGGYSGCWGWLSNTRAGASAHYVVASDGAEISQLVRESNRAWHVSANYECSRNGGKKCNLNGVATNHFSIGIEHAGYASQKTWPAGQIDASARLVCNITRDQGIPRDRYHIVGHGQLQPWNRTDPGANWPWTSYLQKINAACGTTPQPAPTPAPTPTPAPASIIVDSNNANNNQTRGYIQLSANWKSSANVAGYYGTGYWYASTAAISDGAAFYFKLDTDGARTIDAWWTAASDRSTGATFVAFNAQGARIGDGTVNQTANGGKWNQVGRFNFTKGWNKVVLSRWENPGKVVIADAVRVR